MRKIVLTFLVLALLALLAMAQVNPANRSPEPPRKVVFVCEHGAALSLVSAAYFNKIAKEEHLDLHAIARGVTPQENLAPSATNGLKADGLSWEVEKPVPLSKDDAAGTVRIVTFYPIPDDYAKLAPVESWNDVPPTGQGYPAARDAILKHMRELVKHLKASAKRP